MSRKKGPLFWELAASLEERVCKERKGLLYVVGGLGSEEDQGNITLLTMVVVGVGLEETLMWEGCFQGKDIAKVEESAHLPLFN